MNQDEHFMAAALAEAGKAVEKQEVPIGAVVVCNNMIIARAHNMTETLRDPTAHAEMQAITAATDWIGGKYLTECSVYVTVEPCAMCAAALGWSQAGRLVYGTDDKNRGYTNIKGLLLHPKTTVTSGVMKKECGELVEKFFKMRR
ncbi:MAG: nucleoside deaminase [Bacteroidales bacterium]